MIPVPISPGWADHAACVGRPVDEFFPEDQASHIAAVRVCSGCPVRAECLAYALRENIGYGVWGGTAPEARARLARRFRRRVGDGSDATSRLASLTPADRDLVYYAAARHGVEPLALVDRNRRGGRPVLAARIELIQTWAEDGVSIRAIGRRLAMQETTVRYHLQRANRAAEQRLPGSRVTPRCSTDRRTA